jgi:hypothetical protein
MRGFFEGREVITMKHWLTRMCAIGAVLVLAGVASAALTNISGQVTKFEAGKSISVKDSSTGGVQTLNLSKDTTLQGDVRVGAQVSIQADGKEARSINAMASAPGSNPNSPGSSPDMSTDPNSGAGSDGTMGPGSTPGSPPGTPGSPPGSMR